MTDKKNETLKVSRPDTLSLTKTVEGGMVKQNFTRGRTKTVTVEVRKTRNFARNQGGSMVEVDNATRGLSGAEQEARMKALKGLSDKPNSLSQEAPKVPPRRKVEPQKGVVEAKPAEAEAPKPAEVEAPKKPAIYVDEMALRNVEAAKKGAAQRASEPQPIKQPDTNKAKEADDKKKKIKLKGAEGRRQSGKLTISQALNFGEERTRSLSSIKRARAKAKRGDDGADTEKRVREVIVPEAITVQELANRMAERAVDLIKALMKLGTMATPQQSIDADTAELLIEEFGHKIKRVTDADVEDVLVHQEDKAEDLVARPPVVTIMGHVDHGKTSLLDAMREANVVAGEAGGITQHIGAYQTQVGDGKITFLDTPGHEAFTAMRARGASVTDVVILVVAADDGVKPQTEEAIAHAKAAGVPIVVAINKIDKQGADPDRVKNELMNFELIAEDFGGDIMMVPVSAIDKTGLDALQEAVLLQAEMLDLQANAKAEASGVVIESKIAKGRGTVASLLIQRGSLAIGDIVVAGASYGKVRAILNDKGQNIAKGIPAQPVEILGLGEPPHAGDDFAVVKDEKTARDITEYRADKAQRMQVDVSAKSLDQLFAAAGESPVKELAIIIKSDVNGSAEAIIGSLNKFSGDEVKVKVTHSAVGAINESDIALSQATGAIIVGFNVRATTKAREVAMRENIQLRYYSVIYDLIDDIKAALSGMLSPELREDIIGYAEIREVFNVSKVGKIAGCMVSEGMVKRGAKVRLLRDNVVIHEGTLKTLKRFKDEVKEVKNGYECGMAFENYEDIREKDMIECFEVQEIARTVQENKPEVKKPDDETDAEDA